MCRKTSSLCRNCTASEFVVAGCCFSRWLEADNCPEYSHIALLYICQECERAALLANRSSIGEEDRGRNGRRVGKREKEREGRGKGKKSLRKSVLRFLEVGLSWLCPFPVSR